MCHSTLIPSSIIVKTLLKNQAIVLRKKGKSYKEIRKLVPVSKSTLGLWFRSVKLSKIQLQTLTKKKLEGARRGGLARKLTRLKITQEIVKTSKVEVGHLSGREFWLVGLALYWAEGSKARVKNPSQGITFSNSDPKMLKFFLKWVLQVLKIPEQKIIFELYIHHTYYSKINKIRRYWADIFSLPLSKFDRIYYKKNRIKRLRDGLENGYNGLVRIRVLASTNLNRRVFGWTEGVCESCGVV